MNTLPINKYPHSALQLFLDSKGNWAIPVCSSSKYKVLFSVFIYLLIPCEIKGSFDNFLHIWKQCNQHHMTLFLQCT